MQHTTQEQGVRGSLPRLLTLSELSRYLQVSQSTVYRLVERGDLPVYRVGRRLRFDEADVAHFLQDRVQPAVH